MITSTSDCSILIVDDDPDIGFTLQELLEHDGYKVEFVGTGTEALSQTQDRHYNAVILDLGLPDLDGLSVLESLQRMDPTLPVIILTAFTNSERTNPRRGPCKTTSPDRARHRAIHAPPGRARHDKPGGVGPYRGGRWSGGRRSRRRGWRPLRASAR